MLLTDYHWFTCINFLYSNTIQTPLLNIVAYITNIYTIKHVYIFPFSFLYSQKYHFTRLCQVHTFLRTPVTCVILAPPWEIIDLLIVKHHKLSTYWTPFFYTLILRFVPDSHIIKGFYSFLQWCIMTSPHPVDFIHNMHSFNHSHLFLS